MRIIKQLPAEQFNDLQELLTLYRQSHDDRERAEIEQAIKELVSDGRLTETVDPTKEITAQVRQKLRLYQAKVGTAIRRRRESMNLTQAELARKTGIPQSHISRLEKGLHRATWRTMRRIAKALRTRANQLDPGFDHDD
ncbi:helix-turn-helix domain-containing protein [Fontivita pretiosa]|uniref:helix-turn-helix domain-containing protein n=1 Tax=Fontivita pretiosa TaxID=2989684 RepID=UPI003D186A99